MVKGKSPILLLEKKSHGKQKVRTKSLISPPKKNKQTNNQTNNKNKNKKTSK